MRLFKTTLLLLVAQASAWHLQLPIQSTLSSWFGRPIGPSRIPTFILDTQHPWVEQHRNQLERVPNVRELLCNPESIQVSAPGFPDPIPIPNDIFSSLHVDNNRAGISRLGWNNALHRLREIQACAAALRTCESLKVDIYRHGGSKWDDMREPATPPAELPGLFADVLSQMPKLKKLDWVRPSDSGKYNFQVGTTVSPFVKGFAERNLTLPAVEHLLLGPGCESFVTMCLNLTTLETGGGLAWPHWDSWSNETDPYTALVRAAAGVNNISAFTMSTQSWRPELLKVVLESMPHITTLKIHGALDGHQRYSIEEENAEKLKVSGPAAGHGDPFLLHGLQFLPSPLTPYLPSNRPSSQSSPASHASNTSISLPSMSSASASTAAPGAATRILARVGASTRALSHCNPCTPPRRLQTSPCLTCRPL
ncbi:hypothetical protein K438DRAFT_1827430 [Mycena galopus ATCC 62051]|nr:hypothetical protein K438DRAFT_1827430 [Mycena galopus ATCC 62051]